MPTTTGSTPWASRRVARWSRIWASTSAPTTPVPSRNTLTRRWARLNPACTARTASAVSGPRTTQEIDRDDADWPIDRTFTPMPPSAPNSRPATLGVRPIASATRVSRVTLRWTVGGWTSPRATSAANTSRSRATARSASVSGTTAPIAWPMAEWVDIHTGMFASISACWTRSAMRPEWPRRRTWTSSRAWPSRLVTLVARVASSAPQASTRVPGASGSIVDRIRIGMPDSISGIIVRGWNMRAPKVASSSASAYDMRVSGHASRTSPGSAVYTPATSVQIWTSAAPSPRASRVAV